MASTLKQQLAALNQAAPGAKRPKGGKPSLLFDFRTAADVDLQAIYELGSAGFEELVLLEPRYAPLQEPLFSRVAASVSRDQQPPEVVARLDAAIDEFCCLLTQHFLLPAAFKALEYLIRRFKANEHNTDSLMLAALPYHGTNEFVRLLQVLPLDPARGLWSWLAPAQSSGASLPRDLLVARCVNDPRVLHFLCQGARKLGTRKCRSTSFMSFYAVAMCEIVAAVQAVDESFLSRLLPFISSGLEKAAHRDYQAATLIMVAELCSRATLGKEFVKAVVNSTLRNIDHQPDTVRPVLLLLAQVAVTQPQLTTLSEKALKALLATPQLTHELASLKASHVRLSPLLRVITTSLVARLSASAQGAVDALEAPLMELVQSGILEQVAQGLALNVLHAAAEPEAPAEVQAALQRILRALDVRYPAAVDAAVNGALAPLRAPKAGRCKPVERGSSSSEGEEADEGSASVRHRAIFFIVQSTFGGTAGQGSTRALCGDTPLTLSAAAASPAAGVRRMAIQQMGEMLMEMESGSSEAKAQLQSCILQGLQDDDLEVVSAALGAPCTPHLPRTALLHALQPTLQRLSPLLCGAAKASHGTKAASTAARKALHLLANMAAVEAAADGVRDQALLLVLQFVLPVRRVMKVTKAAMKAADQIDHPLATALASLQDLAAGLDAPLPGQTDPKQHPDATEAEGSGKGSKKGGKKGGKKKQQEEDNEEDEQGSARKEQGSKGLKGKAKWDARAAQKVAQEEAAQAVEREAVDVLGKAIYADPAALVPEVLRLLALARGDSSNGTHTQYPQAGATSGEAIQGGGSNASISSINTQQAADPGLLRVRHVLLLALHRALKGAFEWGNEEGGKRGRGSTDATAHVAVLARGLVAACFPELRATLPLLPQQQGGAAGAAEDDQAPLAHWQADANECLEMEVDEGAGLPLEEHSGALCARGQATHAAVLCAALHAAMEAAPELDAAQQQGLAGAAEGGSQQGGAGAATAAVPPPSASKGRGKSARGQAHLAAAGPPLPTVRDMFVGLGGLQPSHAFEEHLRLLVEKALPDLEQRVGFLAALYAAPEEGQGAPSDPTAAQGAPPSQLSFSSLITPPAPARVSALRLHATYIDNGCSNGTKQQQQREVGITLRYLPHVLAAAHSTDAKVREQALDVLGDIGMQLESYLDKDSKSEQGASAAALAPLLSALLRHASLVEADADAVVVLLRNTFAGAAAPGGGVAGAADPPPSQIKGGSKRGGGSRGGKALSGSAAVVPGHRPTQAALASAQLEMEGGVVAVEASFAHLAQLLGGMEQGVVDGKGGLPDAYIAHLLLRGMLQEPWDVSSSGSGVEDAPNGQAGGEGAGGGAGGLPAAATPSQRLALLPHALGLLESLLHTAPQPLSSHAQRLGALLVCCIFSPEPLSAHISSHPATAPSARDLLLALLACSPSSPGVPPAVVSTSRAWFDIATPLRLAALHAVRAGPPLHLMQALQGRSSSQQQHQFHASLVLSLAISSASDASPECRAAASAVIEALPVSDAAVVPVLHAAMPASGQPLQQQQHPEAEAGVQETPSKKPKKSSKRANADAGGADGSGASVAPGEGRLDLAVLLLEVLQWKAVQGEERVVAAAQQLLEALADLMGPLAQPHSALASSPESDDEGAAAGAEGAPASSKKASKRQQKQAAEAAAAAASAASSSLAGYAAQLILTLMEGVARRHLQQQQQQRAGPGGEALGVLSLPLVVRVAQQAPDSAVRNAALSLLAVLAAAKPAAVLSHVLEVLAIVHRSSATTDDTYSHRVGLTALSAVVPAWLEAGKGLQDLWASVVDALPSLPAHRRLGLLSALLQASPQEASLPCALVTLLQAAACALEAPHPEGAEKEQERLGEAAAAMRPSEWLLDLATQLSLQVPHDVRLLCFAALLPASVQAASDEAAALLPRIAVTFVAEQIKSRSLRAHHTQGGASSDELQKGCEALMAQALAQVQALVSAREQLAHPDSAAKKGSSKKSGKTSDASSVRRQERAIRLSIEGLYRLFEGLQAIMASQSYMEALLRLAASPGDKVCRRALRLFADKAASLPTEFERITHQPGISKKDKEAKAHSLATSALKVCPVLSSPSLGSASSLTRQAALLAYTSVLRGCGSSYPQPLLAVLPTAVKCASEDASCAVRGSGLAAIAAAAHMCGAQLVPMLPQASAAVLNAMESTCSKLSTPTALAAAEQRAAAGVGHPAQAAAPDAATASKQQAAEDAEEGGEDAEAAVELAAALSALGALVQKLGPFLSPYLPRLLRALLHPATLARGALGGKGAPSAGAAPSAGGEGGTASPSIAAAANAVRASLPSCVPARLLLQPLFGCLPHAMAAGGMGPTAALMRMVAAAAAGMEASVAAAHHEAIFGFLLRALDVRHTAPPALRGFEPEAEQAAISALVALVLKLSEARFKPLFLRLLEWATLPAISTAGGGGGLGRLVALFGAMDALAVHLRSVLVPYYKYVIDLCVQHLTSLGVGAGRPKKKQRKQQQLQHEEGDASSAAGVDAWVLKGRVLRALHRCFLYDSVGFVDQDKVERLLPALVEQLTQEPSDTAAAAALAAQCAAPDLDGCLKLGARSPRDTYGMATVGVLVQLAVAANSDLHWKPLNRQVLMQTRSASSRTRCLALEVVAHMLDRLREEYLVLLPETLPFLSELIEDPDSAVEARAQDVVKLLEEVSGEKLDEYLKTA